MHNLERLDEALTSKKWKFEFHTEAECPKKISDFYRLHLPHLSAESLLQRIEIGGFYVNGITIDSDAELRAPCKVEYYEPKFELSDIKSIYPCFSEDWIVHEDEYLLVVFKPRRLPCLPTKEQKLYNLKNYIEKRNGRDIHMPSRLDTSTQGLVVISKNPIMHNYLQKAFERKIITKRYLLESAGSADWEHKTVKALISKSKSHAILRQINSSEGKASLTIFSRIPKIPGKNFFLARPLTGRTHQIRLHSSHLGIPILGDNFYGGVRADCLHLLSYQLELWHPYHKNYLDLTVPYELLPEWALDAVY